MNSTFEQLGFTDAQIEYVKDVMEQRKQKTHKAFFDRYGVENLEALDDLFELAKKYKKEHEPEKLNYKEELEKLPKLEELIGLKFVKDKILRLTALNKKNKTLKNKISMNYVFVGNPGTGKTEAARALALEFYNNKIIKEPKFIEVDRSNLVAEYIGQSAPTVRRTIDKALGGVLFIDEAYSLFSGEDDIRDFGTEVLTELNKQLEDHRGELVVILAGYKRETLRMLNGNRGLKSRINSIIEFPNYSKDELIEIAKLMLSKSGYTISKDALDEVVDMVYSNADKYEYANARDLRNTLELLYEFQAYRTLDNLKDRCIEIDDINTLKTLDEIALSKEFADDEPKVKTMKVGDSL